MEVLRERARKPVVWGSCLAILVIVSFILFFSRGSDNVKISKIAQLGGHIILDCSLDVSNQKHQHYFVQWRKVTDQKHTVDGQELEVLELGYIKFYLSKENGDKSSKNDRVYVIPGTTSLNITKVTWEDSGFYKCEVFLAYQPVAVMSKDVKKGPWIKLVIDEKKSG